MSKQHIVRYKKGMKDETDWARVNAMTDKEIDYSDNPATDEAFWAAAKLIMPESKVSLGVRFDRNVVDWFKKQGPGYQTRMNAVLKTYIKAQESHNPRKKNRSKTASSPARERGGRTK
jgi:uncharacterized protein (DUF4415 family)